jgi:hypothetical protein
VVASLNGEALRREASRKSSSTRAPRAERGERRTPLEGRLSALSGSRTLPGGAASAGVNRHPFAQQIEIALERVGIGR